jgi:hypothetical protein
MINKILKNKIKINKFLKKDQKNIYAFLKKQENFKI